LLDKLQFFSIYICYFIAVLVCYFIVIENIRQTDTGEIAFSLQNINRTFIFKVKWLVLLLRTSGDWNETFFIWILNGVFHIKFLIASVLLKGRYALMG